MGRSTRKTPRWDLRVAVTMECEESLYAGISCDVSAGGIFIAMHSAPPVGSEVMLTVTMPDAMVLQLEGVVRWVREADKASAGQPPGCGIEWRDLPMAALRSLLHFAELREPLLFET